jgi:hypothetical protein
MGTYSELRENRESLLNEIWRQLQREGVVMKS